MFQTKTNKEKNWWCEGSKVLQLASDVCDGVKAAKCLADALRALQVRGESEKGFESEIEKELKKSTTAGRHQWNRKKGGETNLEGERSEGEAQGEEREALYLLLNPNKQNG